MAAATCRLAAMRRAVIFAYDDERRFVRAVGAHGIDLDLFAGASPDGAAGRVAAGRSARTTSSRSPSVEQELPEEFHATCSSRAADLHPDRRRRALDRRHHRRPRRPSTGR